MPKRVKHEAHRIEVTKAAWRVILRDGLDRTTIRAIAQELNLTTSVVTHYFRDKDALMSFILDTINEHLETRQQRNLGDTTGFERFQKMILAAFPLDEKGRTEWTIWIAFVGYAIGRETLLEAHRKRSRQNFQMIAAEIEALKRQDLIPQDLDSQFMAKTILALIDGFGLNLVLDPEGFGTDLSNQKLEALISNFIVQFTKA